MTAKLPTVSTTGTIEDVATFFRSSTRTVHEWKEKQLIKYCKEGGCLCFHETAVVDFAVSRIVIAHGDDPTRIADAIRKDWRDHLKVRADWSAVLNQVRALRDRVDALEERLGYRAVAA